MSSLDVTSQMEFGLKSILTLPKNIDSRAGAAIYILGPYY